MASNGLSLQQQKGSLETRIKLLINNDLKTICREFDYQVSGTKATLQQRVIEGEDIPGTCDRDIVPSVDLIAK